MTGASPSFFGLLVAAIAATVVLFGYYWKTRGRRDSN